MGASGRLFSLSSIFLPKQGRPATGILCQPLPKSRGHLTRPQSQERRDCHSGAEGPRGCQESMSLPRTPWAGAEPLVFWWPSQRSLSQ